MDHKQHCPSAPTHRRSLTVILGLCVLIGPGKSFGQSVFADQIGAPCNGVTGTDASAKIQCAINALPAVGGVVNAKLLSDIGGTGSTNIDPGSKAVTILLGPYTYNVTQITLRTSLQIIGSTDGTTYLQSKGSNATPVFVIATATAGGSVRVRLQGFQVFGAAGNTTQEGLFADASGATSGVGLMYSTVDQVCFQHFGGPSIHLKGPNADFHALNQFDTFTNVCTFRDANNTGTGVVIEGANGAIKFINCDFDGTPPGKTGTDIYLGTAAGAFTAYPFSITFDLATIQVANVGVNLNGCLHCEFRNSHHELLNGAYLFTSDGAQNIDTLIDHAYFATNVGVNGGSGYLLNSSSGNSTNTINFTNSTWGNFGGTAPDNIILGTPNLTMCANQGPTHYITGSGLTYYQYCQFQGQTIQADNFQSDQGGTQSAANIVLGSGWGTGATVTAVQGWTQTERFVITSGTGGFSAAPAVTVNFPNRFPMTPLCTLDVSGVTGVGGLILFNIGTLSTASAQFTATTATGAAFTPAGSETYNVVMRCGP